MIGNITVQRVDANGRVRDTQFSATDAGAKAAVSCFELSKDDPAVACVFLATEDGPQLSWKRPLKVVQ